MQIPILILNSTNYFKILELLMSILHEKSTVHSFETKVEI